MKPAPSRSSLVSFSLAAIDWAGRIDRALGRFGRIVSIVSILLLSGYQPSAAGALNGAGALSGDPPISIDAGWASTEAVPPAFFWSSGEGATGVGGFSFVGPAILRITDDFCRGDRFEVFDSVVGGGDDVPQTVSLGTTTIVAQGPCTGTEEVGPAAAYLDPAYSSGTFVLGPGSHFITIDVINNPFGGGRGYVRIDTPVAPVAFSDSYTTQVGTALPVPDLGVLANDKGDQLAAALVTAPPNGQVGLNPDGSFTYTPDPGFTGVDSFTYKATSATLFPGTESEARVTIKVNDPAAQEATVQNVNAACDVTLNLKFNPAPNDTFVIRPTDFHKHWHCHLFKLLPGGGEVEVDPKSLHGAPGITLQISGDPLQGDLQLITAGQTADFSARGNLCQIFNVTDGDYRAECTAENSVPNPTADETGACTDPSGTECLAAPIRVYEETAVLPFTSAGGVIVSASDQCPSLTGAAGGTGCPFAMDLLVNLNRAPLSGASVRVFDRDSTAFQVFTGGEKNPPSTRYPAIYEARQGEFASCVTDPQGRCMLGLPFKSSFLILVKFTNPSTSQADYEGAPGSSSDFKGNNPVASKQINIKR